MGKLWISLCPSDQWAIGLLCLLGGGERRGGGSLHKFALLSLSLSPSLSLSLSLSLALSLSLSLVFQFHGQG